MTHPAFERWRDRAAAAPELSVIVPVRDEAERIVPLLRALALVISRHGFSWELVVADDGSHDDTVARLEALPWINLRVVTQRAAGRGGAIRRGVLTARGDRVFWLDADDATPAGALLSLMLELDVGHDLAIGSTRHEVPQEGLARWRCRLARALRRAAGGLLGVRSGDGPGGAVLMRRRAARELVERLRSDGDGFELELRLAAVRLGLRTAELTVRGAGRPCDEAGALRRAVGLFGDAVRLRHRDRGGAYGRERARGRRPGTNPGGVARHPTLH